MKVIITGSTGMVGEGVMLVCLQHPAVEKVLVINRKPCGEPYLKLREIIHTDFYNLSAIEDQPLNVSFIDLGYSSPSFLREKHRLQVLFFLDILVCGFAKRGYLFV